MKPTRCRSAFRLCSVLFLTAVLGAALAAQTVVTTRDGEVQGAVANGILSFKGIPFAAPPVGKLRWRPPQPVTPWTGIRQATAYGHDCMQLPFKYDAAPLRTTPSEDCLYLNVWEPEHRTGKPLPVMVWIYGGGWVNGGSSPAVYDGSQFAKDGLVFVSFNYRLGRFGFFAHPALTAESEDGLVGNYGYMDQIAALRWVQNNIAAFGGDAKDVTLFGESAGGGAVHVLVNSPMARGLFERAMVESGGGRNDFGGVATLKQAEAKGVAFAAANGITGDGPAALAKLRALPAEAIVNNMNMMSSGAQRATYSGPMIDGRVVAMDTGDSYRAGLQMHIPMVLVANSGDLGFSTARTMQALFAPFGDRATEAEALFNPDHSTNVREVGRAIAADEMMIEPARFVAQTISADGQPAYEFRFSYVADSLRSRTQLASHASEIPYAFDTVKAHYGAATTAQDEQAAKLMHAYWVNFAKSGDPNGPGLPVWPAYTDQNDTLMNLTLDAKAVAERDPWEKQLNLIQHLAEHPTLPESSASAGSPRGTASASNAGAAKP